MPISESMVQDIVQEVMAKMQIADAPTGKHPANLCQNKDGVNCHNCGGACHSQDYKQFPGYQYDFVGGNCDAPAADTANADAELVAKITKQVMAQLGLK